MTRRLLETTTAIGLLTMVAGVAYAQEDFAPDQGAELVRCVLEQQPCPDAADAAVAAAAQMLAEQTGVTIADAEARIRQALPEAGDAAPAPATADAETQPVENEPGPATEGRTAEAPADSAPTPPVDDETAPGDQIAEPAADAPAEEPAVVDEAGEGEQQPATAETETAVEADGETATANEAGDGTPAGQAGEATQAAGEAETTGEQIDKPTEAAAQAETEADADPIAPEPTPEQRAARAERQAQRQADRGNAEALQAADQETDAETEVENQADVQVETVTEETARRSDETVEAESTGQQDIDQLLRNILGIAAGATVGAVLGNQFKVVEPAGDRVVVERDGELVVLRDENELLRRPGTRVRTRTFADGSTRTVIIRENDVRIVTIRAADGTILYRARLAPDGERIVLIDERQYEAEPVDIARLPSPPRARAIEYGEADVDTIRSALAADVPRLDRRYSLQQVRDVRELRALVPGIDLAVNFATGSAAIPPSEAEALTALGRTVEQIIAGDPGELFLVEGHTDTVGAAAYNLALSDRRAESVALALTEYFDIPPENLVTQGYGERFLKVAQAGDIRANRRAVVRRITPLVRAAGER